ncbi:hypothetical protein [Streptomyces sp. NPDC058773]|uniref:hypothetical protein n=1 Tax=Streptomyces sp. NPDC058773 TaxID=3346632 RepID=UPI003673C440
MDAANDGPAGGTDDGPAGDAADDAADDTGGATNLGTVRALHAEALAAVAPWRLGRSVNFLFGAHRDRPDAADVARSVHGADEHRHLAGLKARHDPANLFRFHPAGATTASTVTTTTTAPPATGRHPLSPPDGRNSLPRSGLPPPMNASQWAGWRHG